MAFTFVQLDGSWCSRGNGQDYSGDVTSTESGTVCQEWFSQTPHRHISYSAEELYVAGRECRNPGGRGLRPWCYTSDAFSRWEYCDVPKCSKLYFVEDSAKLIIIAINMLFKNPPLP